MFISFNFENFKFGFVFNNEELDKYEIPRGDFVNLEKVTSEGDMTVNFVGFTNPGINSLVTQPMLQLRPNQTELRSMDYSNQIFCRFRKRKRKVPPPALLRNDFEKS